MSDSNLNTTDVSNCSFSNFGTLEQYLYEALKRWKSAILEVILNFTRLQPPDEMLFNVHEIFGVLFHALGHLDPKYYGLEV